MRWALVGASIAFGSHPMEAQQAGRITGVVLHSASGAAIAGVNVSVAGLELQGTTAESGRFTIEGVPPGLVRLTLRVVGFHPLTSEYQAVLPAETLDLELMLDPVVVAIDPMEVIGEGVRPSWDFGATVITRDKLPPAGDLLVALEGAVPGLQVMGRRDGTWVSIRGSRNDVLYVVDGIVITPPLTFYIDTAEVLCVEVRRGRRAAQEFRRSLNAEVYGGVILIWTRGTSSPLPETCA